MESILITQCLQEDFVKPIGRYERLPNHLHVGYEEARRLMGDHPADGPVARTIRWANEQDPSRLALIHIRDWHDREDAGQAPHLDQFGSHCLQGTDGSRFVFDMPANGRPNTTVVDSLTLNDFQGTRLEQVLAPYAQDAIRVGLMGVWTEAKITYLAYELCTRFPRFQVAVCSALTASSSRTHHFLALDQLSKLLGVRIFSALGEFVQFLGGEQEQIPLALAPASDHPLMEFEQAISLVPADRDLLRHLFRDSKTSRFHVLDGGFSGNVVLGSESTDLFGQEQVPHVVKIGPQGLIGQERAAFERVESVLGNSAPHVADFADYGERGAIKYRYAAMGGGFSTTFQKLYMQGLSAAKTRKILQTVFTEQLGRFYRAATREKCNLLEYYQFNLPQLADRILPRLESAFGGPANGRQLMLPGGQRCPNPYYFYKEDLPRILGMAGGSRYMSTVHGDLNGANIIVDAQENVWLIDFFHTHRGHVLKDLIKLENDLLYIFTPVQNESELQEAFAFTDWMLDIEDLAKPLAAIPAAVKQPAFLRTSETLRLLRSFYPELIHTDRDPLQLWIGMLRYAAHTWSFDESNRWQKLWAIYAASRCSVRITETLEKTGPLRVDWINNRLTGRGRLGITILPGRQDVHRDLDLDIASLKKEHVSHVICLLPAIELRHYGVGELLDDFREAGLIVNHLPILDQKVSSLEEMRGLVSWMQHHLQEGANVVIHCAGGLGRSGLAAACYLKSQGLTAEAAISEIRRVRSQRAIESSDQEHFVAEFEFI